MKIQAATYTFNAVGKTITFSGLIPANLESILHVANVTTGALLFQPQAGPLFTGTWASPVLTLACSTTGMNNTDRLLIFVEDGAATTAVNDGGGSLTVDGPLTDAQLRATAVPVSGTVATGGLTDAQLRAAAVPVSGTVATGGLTDAQLRAAAVPVSGTVATGGLTDAQLRASAVPVTTGGLTDSQLRASAIPVSASALPLPTDAATSAAQTTGNASLSSIDGKIPALSSGRLPVVLPPGGSGLTDTELRAAPVSVTPVQPPFMRVGFAEVGSGLLGKAAEELSLIQTGGGMTVSQASGNLTIATGTTVNSETVIRSIDTFDGSLSLRLKVILSQRIVNQTFRFELADLIREGLAYTINSATSVTVTFPVTNPFTAANVGQSVRLSVITGAAGIPGRYAIASVSGLTVNFTVAAWPGSGSGTLTLYGWNYVQLEYSGATVTNASFDAQRRGWNSGNTTITTQTSASPGHVAQIAYDVFTAGVSDALVASNAGYQWASRGSRIENVPDPETVLYLFIVVQNGSVAPASTTTLTCGFLQIEDQGRQKIRVASSDPVGSHALPVQVLGGSLATQAVSGTVTANIGTGTLAAVTAVTAANLSFPGIIADVPSAALTSTTTTAAFTPTFGIAYSVNIPVTVVTGTTPTLDVAIEESDDSGTNWFKVYDFPRITTTGMYRSPLMRLNGNRVRYVQTVGGTTPSFTRAINRLQNNSSADALRQLIDRSTIVLTSLNSTTPTFDTRDAGNRVQLVFNVGAITTTAPALQMEGSDDNGASWYAIGTPLTAVASSTVQVTAVDINAALMRARVSTAGVGVTAGYVMLKAHD